MKFFDKAEFGLTEKDSPRERIEKILAAADQYFAEHSFMRTPIILDGVKDAISAAEAILKQTDGLCLGEHHSEQASFKFLIDNLWALKGMGVTTVFLEGFIDSEHQPLFDQYRSDRNLQDIPDSLYKYLFFLDNDWGFHRKNHFNPYTRIGFIILAKSFGINLIAIEDKSLPFWGAISDIPNNPSKVLRLKTLNYYCMRYVQEIMKPDEKYIIRCGNKHLHRTRKENIPGISDLLNAGSISLQESNSVIRKPLLIGRLARAQVGHADVKAYIDSSKKSQIAKLIESDIEKFFKEKKLVYDFIGDMPRKICDLFLIITRNDDLRNFKILWERSCLSDANLFITDTDSLLSFAIKNDRFQIFKYLVIEKNADLYLKNANREDVVDYIINHNKSIYIKLLLEIPKIDLNQKDTAGYSLIHRAIIKKNLELASILLAYTDRIDINLLTETGNSVLHIAAKYSNSQLLYSLLTTPDSRLSINMENNQGATPLHIATDASNIDVIKFLIRLDNTDFNITDKKGVAPLHIAAFKNNVEIIRIFASALYKGDAFIDFNILDENQETPLHYAIKSGKTASLDFFIDSASVTELDFNAKNIKGETPLHMAVLHKRYIATQRLLSVEDILVNAKNQLGQTPLHLAVIENNSEMVKILLTSKNIDILAKDFSRKTPLEYAQESMNHEIIPLLEVKSSATSFLKH